MLTKMGRPVLHGGPIYLYKRQLWVADMIFSKPDKVSRTLFRIFREPPVLDYWRIIRKAHVVPVPVAVIMSMEGGVHSIWTTPNSIAVHNVRIHNSHPPLFSEDHPITRLCQKRSSTGDTGGRVAIQYKIREEIPIDRRQYWQIS